MSLAEPTEDRTEARSGDPHISGDTEVASLEGATFDLPSGITGITENTIRQIRGALEDGKIDKFTALLVLTVLERKREKRADDEIGLYLQNNTKIEEALAGVDARRELKIPDPKREEFLAIGELVFAAAAAEYSPGLLQKIDALSPDRPDHEMPSTIGRLARRKLVEPIAPLPRLLVREAKNENNTFEQAILEGIVKRIITSIPEPPDGVMAKIGGMFVSRAKCSRYFPNLLPEKMTASAQALLEQLFMYSQRSENGRAKVWTEYLASMQAKQRIEEEREARKGRLEAVDTPEEIDERLEFLFQQFQGADLLRELEALLYLDVSLTQPQFHKILEGIPRGLSAGVKGGFRPMREEMSRMRLGTFEALPFEPIDRYIAWLALHRLSAVVDHAQFKSVEKQLIKILEQGTDWRVVPPKYQAALKYLFHNLVNELETGDIASRAKLGG